MRKVAEGAALMTECVVSARNMAGMSNLIGKGPLEQVVQATLERLGVPDWDAADRAFAERIRATLHLEDITAQHSIWLWAGTF